ncbi:MAG: PQQ-binding-like beta-propeller repeat protein, partial [Planctomycetota bacterium]
MTRPLIAVTLGLFCIITLPAASHSDWLRTAALHSDDYRFRIQAGSQTSKTLTQQARDSLLTTEDIGLGYFGVVPVQLTEKAVVLGDRRLRLTPWPKDNKDKRRSFVRWIITLKEETELRLHIGRACNLVLLDGEVLVDDGKGHWHRRGDGRLDMRLSAGEHQLLAASWEADRNPPPLTVAIEMSDEDFQERILDRFRRPLADDQAEDYRHFLLERSAEIDADGAGLATGIQVYGDWIASRAKAKPAEAEKLHAETGGLARDLAKRLPYLETAYYYVHLQKHASSWLLDNMLHPEKPDFDFLSLLIARLAEAGLAKEVPGLARTAEKRYEQVLDQDEKERARFYDRLLDRARGHLADNGAFEEARYLYKMVARRDDLKDRRERELKQTRDKVDLLDRTKVQLNFDPEAQQHYHEFRLLLERGAADERTIASAFSLFRRASGQMRLDDMHVRSLLTDMAGGLRADEEFRSLLRSHAAERLQGSIDDALERRDLDRIEQTIVRFGELLETGELHRYLMRERLDRGQLDAARHHAVRLLNSRDEELQTEAAATLLVMQHHAGVDPRTRFRLPEHLRRKRIHHMGEELKLETLEDRLWGDADQERGVATAGPGRHIGSAPLPLASALDRHGHRSLDGNRLAPRQPLEPRMVGDHIVLGTPLYTAALDRATGAIAWQRQAPLMDDAGTEGRKHNTYPIFDTGSASVVLRRTDSGDGWSLRAFDTEGRRLWDSADHPIATEWEPYCVPYGAFGSNFVLVWNRSMSDQVQVALARIDLDDGRIHHIQPIDQMSTKYSKERMRFDQHFIDDGRALYGFTGTGALFKIDAETLEPEWTAAVPLHEENIMDAPAAAIALHGSILTAYLPSVQRWIAVDRGSGLSIWSRQEDRLRHIHSRGDDRTLVASYAGGQQGDLLVRIDPSTGTPLWRREMHDLRITGEGCIVGNRIWIPTLAGLADVERGD